MIRIIRKWYVIALIVVILLVIGENILSYLINEKVSALPHIFLGFIVLILTTLKSRYSKIFIKVWAAISVIGGFLVFLSALLFWLGGAPERIEYDSLLVALGHVVIGGMFYWYCDKSIEIIKDTQ